MEAVPVSTRVAAPLVAQALAAVLVAEVLLAAMGAALLVVLAAVLLMMRIMVAVSPLTAMVMAETTIIAEIWIVAATVYQTAKTASAEDEIDLDLRICNYIPDEPEQDNGPSYFSEVRDVLQNNKEKIDKITKTTTKLSMAAGEAIGSIVPGTEKIAGAIVGTGAFLTAKTAAPIVVGAGVALKRAHQAAKNAGWHPGVRMDDQ